MTERMEFQNIGSEIKGEIMKRLMLLFLIRCAIIILADLVNKIGAEDGMSVEGHILNKEGVLYLITDEDIDIKTAKEQSNQEFIRNYEGIYRLDSVPFSLSRYKDGQKMKIWFGKVLESHPAKVNVLKAESK